jgi:hypothetical protein
MKISFSFLSVYCKKSRFTKVERSGDLPRARQTGAAVSWSPLRGRLRAAPAPQTAQDTSAAATAAGSACAAAQVSAQSTYCRGG